MHSVSGSEKRIRGVVYRQPRLRGVDDAERFALLALHAAPGLGPKRIRRLMLHAGSAAAVLRNPMAAGSAVSPRILRMPERSFLERGAATQQMLAKECGAQTLYLGDRGYPACFLELEEPPIALHVLGNAEILSGSSSRTAVIGARACTPYGRSQAIRFGKGLGFSGEVLVSGVARGIDQFAMFGALEAEGPVIGVLGSGLDKPYPQEGLEIMERTIHQGGAIVSEFPFGTAPKAGHFPRRNRLIAALGRAVLVIQATNKSGTMNTVDWALGLGREVYALPGPVDDLACSGTNRMLAEGAGMALSPEQMLCELDRCGTEEDLGKEPPLLRQLTLGDASAGGLAAQSGLAEAQVRMELTDLEMQGRVMRLPDGRYHRCGPRP